MSENEYRPEQVPTMTLPEMTPNQCGVICDYAKVVCHKENGEYICVEIGRYKGKYYNGYSYGFSTFGGGSPVSCIGYENWKPQCFDTIIDAYNNAVIRLRNFQEKQVKTIAKDIPVFLDNFIEQNSQLFMRFDKAI